MSKVIWEEYRERYLSMTDLKVEIGGGPKTLAKAGFINVDREATADVVLDLETMDVNGLPFDSDSVGHLYTSHCIEHIRNLRPLMREILRVVKVGGVIEIRVPHFFSSMACCFGHVHTIATEQINHWTQGGHCTDFWFGDLPKKLVLTKSEFIKGPAFARWKKLLPHASDKDLFDLCNDACHESRWTFQVQEDIK